MYLFKNNNVIPGTNYSSLWITSVAYVHIKRTDQMWPVDLFSGTGNFCIMTITGPGSKFIRTIPRAIRKFITDHVGPHSGWLEPKTCPNSYMFQ